VRARVYNADSGRPMFINTLRVFGSYSVRRVHSGRCSGEFGSFSSSILALE
jgi:hypothetical protein